MSIVAFPAQSANHELPYRQAAGRQYPSNQPLRPYLKRGSPLALVSTISNASKQILTADSSDDEGSAPLLSAEAKEILGVRVSATGPLTSRRNAAATSDGSPRSMVENLSGHEVLESFRSPVSHRNVSPAAVSFGNPRIVRLSGGSTGSATLRRTVSTSSVQGGSPSRVQHAVDLVTPAPRPWRIKSDIATNTHPNKAYLAEQSLSSGHTDGQNEDIIHTEQSGSTHDGGIHGGSVTVNRVKNESTGANGSLRIKRVGTVTGRYMSGPARRGVVRRQSDEEQSPAQQMGSSLDSLRSPAEIGEIESHGPLDNLPPQSIEVQDLKLVSGNYHSLNVRLDDESQINKNAVMSSLDNLKSQLDNEVSSTKSKSTPASVNSNSSTGKRVQPIFKVPPLPALPSRHDQENEPPPTFKRNKLNGLDTFEKPRKMAILITEKMLVNNNATTSPQRKALAPRSQNTPLRPAPPPPKMTVIDTVTATAGAASASQSKKKRNYISVNGKLFTRMDCIGRGGSAKVYRVMAENYKVFALKRVSLEDVDEMAIRGYKGEIELLRKLENVDRVIRLFDYEINDERQTLSILMEMGESDFSRILNLRLNADNARFDISFTRYFWKEMLECVQAIHQHDIVHSDLKPANFLLVQGRLKLIDFGIANAIQDDTVNVHREQQIGTPNYMSPEALVDSNATSGLPSSVGKIMKLGKPSDVWSLGCILYQMVYGKPPFAHITNQLQRVMAIPNPSHVIQYPATGVGSAAVPAGLIFTLRDCLNRNLNKRPTVVQLLMDSDPFLHPDTQHPETVPVGEELISRIQYSIIKHIQDRGMPSETELAAWPARFFSSIKAAVAERRT
ncbi:Dual-specificity kinase, spindle pole body (SPB) duplication and spindle checkpoint function [Ptychographa xylographoides]|nr:Dual-specificity kinase, spindle pole body (SPB) duplication and spindle checkpoint function [Ptychographa xylographoides]